MKRIIRVLTLSLVLAASLPGLHVKVISVDHKASEISVLLPMHNVHIEAALAAQEDEIRVRPNKFYKAKIEPGRVDTIKRNVLRIDIPKKGSVRFRIRKITFLERSSL